MAIGIGQTGLRLVVIFELHLNQPGVSRPRYLNPNSIQIPPRQVEMVPVGYGIGDSHGLECLFDSDKAKASHFRHDNGVSYSLSARVVENGDHDVMNVPA